MGDTVHIVIGAWGGCIEQVTAWREESDAEKEKARLSRKWGIVEGHEEESPHDVSVWPVEIS